MRFIVPAIGIALIGASAPASSELDGLEAQNLRVAEGIDRMTTGGTVRTREREAWQKLRETYRECPSCLAQQPFPLDEREGVGKRENR